MLKKVAAVLCVLAILPAETCWRTALDLLSEFGR